MSVDGTTALRLIKAARLHWWCPWYGQSRPYQHCLYRAQDGNDAHCYGCTQVEDRVREDGGARTYDARTLALGTSLVLTPRTADLREWSMIDPVSGRVVDRHTYLQARHAAGHATREEVERARLPLLGAPWCGAHDHLDSARAVLAEHAHAVRERAGYQRGTASRSRRRGEDE